MKALFPSLLLLTVAIEVVAEAWGAASEETGFQALPDPVVVSGQRLEALTGASIPMLRLVVFRDGRAETIPFQIDQRDSRGGWVWDVAAPAARLPDLLAQVETPADRTHDDQDPPGKRLLDGNDLLVFMARDLGERQPLAPKVLGTPRVLSISVAHPHLDRQGWAYLALYPASPPPLAQRRYMHYQAGAHRVSSPVYAFSFLDDKVALLKDLVVNGAVLMDRIRIQGEVRIELGPLRKTLRFTEDDIRGYIDGYIDGPVRIIKRTIPHLALLLGLPGPGVHCDHFYYPFHAEVPVCLIRRFPVQGSSLRLTAAFPATVSSYSLGNQTADEAMLEAGEGSAHASCWIAFGGTSGSVVSVLLLPETIQDYTATTPFATSPTEGAAGAGPELGFNIQTEPGFPAGDYRVQGTYVFSAQPYREGITAEALRLLREPLQVRVGSEAREPAE